ncbi:hypothetical protein [Pinibacter soli]|uniref:Uncharacterized protein n=1 Tax=Pinibacter soli TaxID=3044211 RepID=A0ABT6RHC1_9BACT|nr:hypothetical protein [Pinibacter soli]MDI3321871.1 hypothetical protein [Pinibacter soli]
MTPMKPINADFLTANIQRWRKGNEAISWQHENFRAASYSITKYFFATFAIHQVAIHFAGHLSACFAVKHYTFASRQKISGNLLNPRHLRALSKT